jgi:hypothetical protein
VTNGSIDHEATTIRTVAGVTPIGYRSESDQPAENTVKIRRGRDFCVSFRLTYVKNPFSFRASVSDGQNRLNGLILYRVTGFRAGPDIGSTRTEFRTFEDGFKRLAVKHRNFATSALSNLKIGMPLALPVLKRT